MKMYLNTPGKLSDCVDFSEATLFFYVPAQLEDTVKFEAWGITFLATPEWRKLVGFPDGLLLDESDIYVSGKSKIILTGIVGGEISVALYDSSEKNFIKDSKGDNINLKRNWDYNIQEDVTVYNLGSVLDWPNGYCSLDIAAHGNMIIEFETDNCISAREYCLDPERYSYNSKYI